MFFAPIARNASSAIRAVHRSHPTGTARIKKGENQEAINQRSLGLLNKGNKAKLSERASRFWQRTHKLTEQLAELRTKLAAHGQSHVLNVFDRLSGEQRLALLAQLQHLDLDQVDVWVRDYVRNDPAVRLPSDLEPAPCYARSGDGYDAALYREQGVELIREGKLAAFTVAGGQGTRLGWNGPKGTYPATPIIGKPLFQCFAEQILATQIEYGVDIPWYIMTSPLNDDETRAFFVEKDCFGLNPENLRMFPQGVLPSLSLPEGKLLLSAPHELAVNPDGHGGSLRALAMSGALEEMQNLGIQHISYFQVDNPLVNVIDPLFIGLHVHAPDSSAEMSSKMVSKIDAEEKVGVFARGNERTMVIEYSDLPRDLGVERDAAGELRFRAGSIAIHLLAVEFVQRLTDDAGHVSLPMHRAKKKVPYIDPRTGDRVDPDKANAIKLEMFVFDALPQASASIVLETDRAEEFAPIKNLDGNDSLATSQRLQNERAGRWLEQHGVSVPRTADGPVDARIEIGPLFALDADSLGKRKLPTAIARGEDCLLDGENDRI